jgi:histidinol-phosphate aminotransferase
VKKIYPSHANFLLVKVPDAKKMYDDLVSNKIIVRDRSKVVLCEDCLRITVGTRKENEAFLQSFKKLAGQSA